MANADYSKMTQRELVLAALRRNVGKDNCAGAKHGHGAASQPKTK